MPGPFDAERIIYGAPELVWQHTSLPAVGWDLAIEIANFHWEMLSELIAGWRVSSPSDNAVVAIATHGLNLYTEILSAGARGMFDAAAHMCRGLVDCSGLVVALAQDPASLEAFMSGEQGLAAKGRQISVNLLASIDPGNSENTDAAWRKRQLALNRLAHVSLFHGDNVIESQPAGWRPNAGGRLSIDSMRALCYATMNADNELMLHLVWVNDGRISTSWGEQLMQLQARVRLLEKD